MRIHYRCVATDDVRDQVTGARSDAEAVTAEAGGQHDIGNSPVR